MQHHRTPEDQALVDQAKPIATAVMAYCPQPPTNWSPQTLLTVINHIVRNALDTAAKDPLAKSAIDDLITATHTPAASKPKPAKRKTSTKRPRPVKKQGPNNV